MPDNKVYYVFELQTYGDGTGTAIPMSYPTLREAESKFYLILSAAALSTVYRHGAVLMTEEGIVMKQEVFTHMVEENTEE